MATEPTRTSTDREREVDELIARVEPAIAALPDCAVRLIGLAGVVLEKGAPGRAFELCRKAVALSPHDSEVDARARLVLSQLIPRYHLPMMNDARRNAMWGDVLEKAVRSSARALEIGTGGGMLALIAARAGARQVVTCERNPVLAAVAQEVIAANGYDDRVKVVAKDARDLVVGLDLDAPADLLFCDIFSDTLLGFDPLPALTFARTNLLTANAVVLPRSVTARIALAEWPDYARRCDSRASGFTFESMRLFLPQSVAVPAEASGLVTLSDETEILALDLNTATLTGPPCGTVPVKATRAGTTHGIVQWIRTQLDEDHVLESGPSPGKRSFSSPVFHPLRSPLAVLEGDSVDVRAVREGEHLYLWA